MIEGARKARGIAVIIDVFRAFTFEAYAMANGAETIIPVGDMDLARKLKSENPAFLLAGERKGIVPDDFDFGNSPSQIANIDLTGKTIIHTTSAGTQGIANAINADEIITGALVNAKAIAKYIKQNNFQDVSLVCMGLEAVSETEEDNLCAEYIRDLLEGKETDISAEAANLAKTSGAKFLDPNKSHMPEADFGASIELNKFDFVLKVEKHNGLDYVKKIDLIR
ncbi:putative 2-phosphosulfolactate phosphatase [Clostridia bacterium]|nr:putative 2-phosphosulfolactate phosphatase [Clostridia bacterium]